MILFTFVLIVLLFIGIREPIARIFIVTYVLFFFCLEVGVYWLVYRYMYYIRQRNRHDKRVLLLGYDETSALFRQMIDNTPLLGYRFAGYVLENEQDIEAIPVDERPFVLGCATQMDRLIEQQGIRVVFSVFSYFRNEKMLEEQLHLCNQMGIRMFIVSEHRRWLRRGNDAEMIGNFLVMNPQRIPLDNLFNRFVKRAFDLVFSSAVILCFGWNLLPLIMLLIKLTSKGPVFFVQERTGADNVPFRCYKFRSMYLNGDSDRKQATRNDSRITPFGRFMREWSIDELPQFYNVLCGQMSVVGPRPHMISHTEQYAGQIQYYKFRHCVKPGITGWAQVNGWRGETDENWKMEKRVKYDTDYIENWSFLWDIKIIWLTLFGKNAWKNAG
jgi:Undecaprenyl-phosphate glucose phosphotransferase